MQRWLGDYVRLLWGAPYWNTRKALFRLRGSSGRAPCQHPSDSGRAGETDCEACIGWRSRANFRLLCPLLAEGDHRRLCSVGAAEVRPFWGRAALILGSYAAAAALVVLLGVFVTFRVIGYRVSVADIAWPPRWHQVQSARADYFYRMALRAYAASDVRRAVLALGQVYSLDPMNVPAARLLALYTQIANPSYSDLVYTHLLDRHLGNRDETAQAWFRALLARGDFRSVSSLSARMLQEGRPGAAAWSQALLFSEEMTGASGDAERVLANSAGVAGEAKHVISLAQSLRGTTKEQQVARVQSLADAATTNYEVYYSLGRLIGLGREGEALERVGAGETLATDTYDRESLKLDAYSSLGWKELEANEAAALLEPAPSERAVALVTAHLIRYPDPKTARGIFEQLDRTPLPATPENTGAHMALLCMAGVNGLQDRVKQECDSLGTALGGRFASADAASEFFGPGFGAKNTAVILPQLLALPIDVVYALITEYHARAPAAAEGPPAGDNHTHD